MGLRASFSVTEDLGYPSSTTHYQWPIDYSEGCAVFVDRFLEVARNLVPVDTGYLQSRLDASTDGDEITCEDDCEYAQYVEYGTIRMGAQPYFEPAIEAAYDAAKPYWDDALDEAQQMDGRKWADDQSSAVGGGKGLGGFFGNLFGVLLAAFIVGIIRVLGEIISGRTDSGIVGSGGISVEIT